IFNRLLKSFVFKFHFICCAVVRGLRPANGILLRLWTLQHLLMQLSRSIWIMLVIWLVGLTLRVIQELVAKNLESSDLNFSRYGDTFFEVSF
ncbi:hypothetical protein Goshw_017178, partial [Gossypium schwendimanii]|nr:hypothetical protein [Gossypium schwendimanii]